MSDMVFQGWIKCGIDASVIFSEQCTLVRAIRRMWIDYFLPGYWFWFADWKNKLSKYDVIIVNATERTRTLARFIHKVKPSMRIIYWYWNPVNSKSLPELTKDDNVEFWSFDRADCEKYSMKYNVQYYDSSNLTDDMDVTIDYDVYFIGHDKGRLSLLKNLMGIFAKYNVSIRFDIIGNHEKNIPYCEVQKRVAKTKAILEINQRGQTGITLRALEALFFRKKLITNNAHIIQEDFYNPNNIFIIGKDDMSLLKDFLSQPYDTAADSFRSKHTIDAWFSNFFI